MVMTATASTFQVDTVVQCLLKELLSQNYPEEFHGALDRTSFAVTETIKRRLLLAMGGNDRKNSHFGFSNSWY
ncbi:hypothetical protein PUN28_012516 [Cardiocondyla obscurior]|uniref:Uncharacterized protein n=1 Tax=Cardiocondyla obscurior TaxID=286306 RepID=A0AAW2FGV7_9HYME